MKSKTSHHPARTRTLPPAMAIALIVAAIALFGGAGWFWLTTMAKPSPQNDPKAKQLEYMLKLSPLAKERWAKEQAQAKREGRPPNEKFRPGPGMAPIGDMKPLR